MMHSQVHCSRVGLVMGRRGVGSVRNEGGLGGPGPPQGTRDLHKKEKRKLGGPTFHRCTDCNYPSAVAPVAACVTTLVRLC